MANVSGFSNSGLSLHRKTAALTLLALAVALPIAANAQASSADPTYVASSSETVLPDAPIPMGSSGSMDSTGTDGPQRPQSSVAPHFAVTIRPGQTAQHLRTGDKILMGFRASVSEFTAVGWVVSAGEAQAVDGSPNYGQTGKGFAQRLGAAAARNTSQDLFTYSILAPALHEDFRYYRMGDGHSFVKRTAYAITRPLITRTDGGHSTINFAMIGGNLSGAAMTQLYYPPTNRGFDETMKTFGGSMGGSAVGFVVREFIGDALRAIHSKRDM